MVWILMPLMCLTRSYSYMWSSCVDSAHTDNGFGHTCVQAIPTISRFICFAPFSISSHEWRIFLFNSRRLSPRHSRLTRDMHSFVLIMHTHKSNPLHSITSAHSRVSSSSSSSAFWLRHSRHNIHELLLFVFLCSQNIWGSSAGYKLSSSLFASSRSFEKRRFDDWNRYAMIIGFLFTMLRIFRGIWIPCLRRSEHNKDCIIGLSC